MPMYRLKILLIVQGLGLKFRNLEYVKILNQVGQGLLVLLQLGTRNFDSTCDPRTTSNNHIQLLLKLPKHP